jgi:hypothetical protein
MDTPTVDILNLLKGTAPAAAGPTPFANDAFVDGPSFDMLFGALVSSEATQGLDLPAVTTRGHDNSDIEGSALPGKFNADRPAVADQGEALTQSQAVLTHFRPTPFTLDRGQSTMPGAGSVELNPGSYTVLNWNLKGDTLTLDVAPVDDQSRTLTITLSADRLQADVVGTLGENARRLALDGRLPNPHRQLNALLEKLNVKELEVKPAPQQLADSVTASDKLELRLFAENAGRQVVIQASLSRDLVRTHLRQEGGVRLEQSPAKLSDSDGKTPLNGTRPTDTTAHGNSAVRTAWNMQFRGNGSSDEILRNPRLGNLESDPKSGTADLPDFMRSSTELTANRRPDTVPRMRFTLPEESRLVLRPNGKSVHLKIDPEHLGPARLSLTLNNDRLQALVIVDNHQARQTVEASLDRLLQTLARADIKVDYINVAVDQHGAEERLFEQHSGHYYAARPGRLTDFTQDDELIAPETMAAGSIARTADYIGSRGVNILA